MANQDNPNGFVARTLRGTDPAINVFAPTGYSIVSGQSGSIFLGDLVKSTGTASSDGRPGVSVAAAGNTVRGSFAGVQYTDSNGERQYSKTWVSGTVATDIVAHVFDDPDTVFEVQCDGAFAATDVGNKADFVVGTGNSQTGISAMELDSSDIATGDGLLILGLAGINNDAANAVGTNANVLVLLREHELRGTLTAV